MSLVIYIQLELTSGTRLKTDALKVQELNWLE